MSKRVSVQDLKRLLEAFNMHDRDAIMQFFTEDSVFDMPHSPDPYGRRYIGKAAVREGLATRLACCPTFITGRTAIGSQVKGDVQNGRSQAPDPRERKSTFEVAIFSSSGTGRSRRRTRSGRSYSDKQRGLIAITNAQLFN